LLLVFGFPMISRSSNWLLQVQYIEMNPIFRLIPRTVNLRLLTDGMPSSQWVVRVLY